MEEMTKSICSVMFAWAVPEIDKTISVKWIPAISSAVRPQLPPVKSPNIVSKRSCDQIGGNLFWSKPRLPSSDWISAQAAAAAAVNPVRWKGRLKGHCSHPSLAISSCNIWVKIIILKEKGCYAPQNSDQLMRLPSFSPIDIKASRYAKFLAF